MLDSKCFMILHLRKLVKNKWSGQRYLGLFYLLKIPTSTFPSGCYGVANGSCPSILLKEASLIQSFNCRLFLLNPHQFLILF